MSIYKRGKRGKVWWYKFTWNGELIRESTKQPNKQIARQLEAARKTQLAKGEAGIKDHKAPTLKRFINDSFLPFVERTKSGTPNTTAFYRRCCKNLLAWPALANSRLTEVDSAMIGAYICQRQDAGRQAATINRELATLRRALNLANEWHTLAKTPPKIRLLDGEICRERVLTQWDEDAYLKAADPLLRTVATIMLDCGLRPDEVYRLKWNENYRDRQIIIHTGKTRAARRSIPASGHVAALLEMRRSGEESGWIFPAPTKTGHIDLSSIRKAHERAIKLSGVAPFVLYELRHTCLTRWAKYLDPFTLKKLAGHESLETTMKYIHLNESESAARLKEARNKLVDDAVEEFNSLGMEE